MADSSAVVDRVVAVLNCRLATGRVADIVELLYAHHTSTLSELASYAKNRRNNPYPAKVDFNSRIDCGHHPWLHAELVFDLEASQDPESRVETLRWKTYPIYRPADAGPEVVQSGSSESYTRRVTGAVSSEIIWDRERGRVKDEFSDREL